MRVAGIRRLGHPDAQVSHRDFPGDQFQRGDAAVPVRNGARREGLPHALGGACRERAARAGPKLNGVASRVRIGPGDANGIDIRLAAEIDHHPLRMQRIIFTSELASQVRIAFPVRLGIAIGEPRPSVSIAAAESAMRQRIGPGIVNRFAKLGTAGEIAFLLFRIAPHPARIPVPGFGVQFGVLAIGDGLPAGVQDLLENGAGQNVIGRSGSQAIDTGAERAEGAEGVDRARSVHGNGLGKNDSRCEDACWNNFRFS